MKRTFWVVTPPTAGNAARHTEPLRQRVSIMVEV